MSEINHNTRMLGRAKARGSQRGALPIRVWRRLLGALGRRSLPLRAKLDIHPLHLRTILAETPPAPAVATTAFADWRAYAAHVRARSAPRFFASTTSRDRTLSQLRELDGELPARTTREADRILDHEFDLLGSGPVLLGARIDWNLDPLANHRWSAAVPARQIQATTYPGGADIKWPWELSRCQHFVVLGQAYWFTERDEYAEEFARQVIAWIEDNPIRRGVNWVCTMDVALRAIGWIWGYELLSASPALGVDTRARLFRALFETGRFIVRNLEYHETLTSNHYFSNLVGLIYLGCFLREFPEARSWRAFATVELRRELRKQVQGDGTDFEASTGYHRLVTEMALSATILAQRNGVRLGHDHLRRLESMVEAVAWLTRANGTVPLIGDHDNGRVHRLARWDRPDREWADFRYLLGIGAALFQRPDLATLAGDQWQEAIWLLGPDAVEAVRPARAQTSPAPFQGSRAFPDAGWFVLQGTQAEVTVTAGSCGQRGNGGHAHGDVGSFVFHAGGLDWIVDPGSYVYTRDYDARHEHRRARAHNRIVVDGREPDAIDRRRPFQLGRPDPPEVCAWSTASDRTDLRIRSRAWSHGDARSGVIWERSFQVVRDRLLVEDHVAGRGEHLVEAFFHLAPGVSLTPRGGDRWSLTSSACAGAEVVVDANVSAREPTYSRVHGWVSTGYGSRRRGLVLVARWRGTLPMSWTWCIEYRGTPG